MAGQEEDLTEIRERQMGSATDTRRLRRIRVDGPSTGVRRIILGTHGDKTMSNHA